MDLWANLVKGTKSKAQLIQVEKQFLLNGLLMNKELKLRECFENTFKELAKISSE